MLLAGKYRVKSTLGEGGMGVVLAAWHVQLEEHVAIKLLHPEVARRPDAIERFFREARVVMKLRGEHVVRIHDLGTLDEGVPFIVMEYLEGSDLGSLLRDRGPMPIAEAVDFVLQACVGVAEAHTIGVVHRDLKPGNLFLTMRVDRTPCVKVLDFGISKVLRDGPAGERVLLEETLSDSRPAAIAPKERAFDLTDTVRSVERAADVTGTDAIMGSPHYMAPEQIRCARDVDARADIWSLGVILYELLSGARPFDGDDFDALRVAILGRRARTLQILRDVPLALEEAIETCLAKEPPNRFQDVHAFVEAIAPFASDEGRVCVERIARMARSEPRQRSRRITSLAVLPVETDRKEPANEYFSEGITEALIRALSELSFRKIIARSSVYEHRGRDPLKAGRELGVEAVLTGRLVFNGNDALMTAELLDVTDGQRLWGGRFNHSVAELPRLQAEVANEICHDIQSMMDRGPQRRVASKGTTDLEAYRAYLQGRYSWNRRPAKGAVKRSIELFEKSAALDPAFALAHAGLADSYNTLGGWEAAALPPRIAFEKSKIAAQQALKLDEDLAEAHASLGYAKLHYDWDWPSAEREFRHAIAISPSYSHARHWYSHLLIALGRTDEALRESVKLVELDPQDLIINVHTAFHHYMAHQYEESLNEARRTLDMDPNFHWGYFFSGLALERLGEKKDAMMALERSVDLSGQSLVMISALGYTCGSAGQKDRAVTILRELKELSETRYVPSYEIGLIHASLQEPIAAMDWLEKAYAERSGWLPYLGAEPRLEMLHSDDRFKQLVDAMAFPSSSVIR